MSAGRVVIREAVAEDASGMVELARELARGQGGMPERISAEWIGENMLARDGPVRVLVAECGTMLVGYVAWSPMVETIYASAGSYVSDLVVTESRRGQGIGRLLLAAAAGDARGRGLRHLWLVTASDREGTERFYRRIANIRQEVVGFAFADETFERLADEGEAAISGSEPRTTGT